MGKADVPIPPGPQPSSEIQAEIPPAKPDGQSAARTPTVTLENHKGFALQVAKVGLIVGFLVVVWLCFNSVKANPTANEWTSSCMFLAIAGTGAAILFGLLFWAIGFVLHSIFLSIKNARDPEVQKIMRQVEEADEEDPDEEEWWCEQDPLDPNSDTNFQSEADMSQDGADTQSDGV